MALAVFLKGVNVGGYRRFRPTMLAEQLRRYDVVSIGAAGTFIVRAPPSQAQLRAAFRSRIPFETEVFVCKGDEVLSVSRNDPFDDEPGRTDIIRFVSILAGRPRSPTSVPRSFPTDGRWVLRILAVEGRFALGVYRREMKAIGYLSALDEVFGVPATTRNSKTFAAVQAALRERS